MASVIKLSVQNIVTASDRNCVLASTLILIGHPVLLKVVLKKSMSSPLLGVLMMNSLIADTFLK